MGPENNRVGNGENDDEDDRGGGGCPNSADDNDDDSASWFYKPFKYARNWMLSVDDEFRAENNGRSTDNVWSNRGFDRSNV